MFQQGPSNHSVVRFCWEINVWPPGECFDRHLNKKQRFEFNHGTFGFPSLDFIGVIPKSSLWLCTQVRIFVKRKRRNGMTSKKCVVGFFVKQVYRFIWTGAFFTTITSSSTFFSTLHPFEGPCFFMNRGFHRFFNLDCPEKHRWIRKIKKTDRLMIHRSVVFKQAYAIISDVWS